MKMKSKITKKMLSMGISVVVSSGIFGAFPQSENSNVSPQQVLTENGKSSYKEFTAKITDWDNQYIYVSDVKTNEKYVIDGKDVAQKYKIGSLVNVQYFGDGEKMNVTDFQNK